MKTARIAAASPPRAPLSEGRLAARVFYLFDHGRELREIVEELGVPPHVVRDLWHEWMIDPEDGEAERKKSAQDERQRRAEERERQELERREALEEQNFVKIMAAISGMGRAWETSMTARGVFHQLAVENGSQTSWLVVSQKDHAL